MARLSKPLLLLAALSAAAIAHAELLPKPEALSVDEAAGPRISWSPVEGAALYRVAVFDAADAEGKRPLLAAVWVSGTDYVYAKGTVIPKAGKLGSTKPLPLPAGRKLRVMVAAAREQGADKSDWVGTDFSAKAPAQAEPTLVPTALPSPTPTLTPLTGKPQADAEMELEGGEEFKSSPEPTVIDLGEGSDGAASTAGIVAGAAGAAAGAGAGAGAASAAGATAGQAATGAGEATAAAGAAAPKPSLEAARALVKAGKPDDAEAMFKALTEADPKDSDAWEGLGDAFAARQMKVEALDAYEQALKTNKTKKHLQEWIDKNVRR